jgi:adenosylcobinamide-GDP ribazoletransferase
MDVEPREGASVTARATTHVRGPVGGIVDEIRAAMGLLTRIPVSRGNGADALPSSTGAAAFGLVGALVGAIGGVAVLVVGSTAPLAAGALAVAAMAGLSGALHLDGLADTADALAVGDPARAEAARQDPRVGSAGAVAIVTAVLIDAALLASLSAAHGVVVAAAACVVAGAGSRAFATAAGPLARGRLRADGSGSRFAARGRPRSTLVSLATAVAIAAGLGLATGMAGLVLGLVGGLAIGFVAAEWLVRARGSLDGDGIGAIVETTFAAILAVTAFAASVRP